MFNETKPDEMKIDWNVLNSPWLEVMTHHAESQVCSPLKALEIANQFRCIIAASPLDLFAAHRFLLTLLYWKADSVGGVQRVRESLLKGKVPPKLLGAIETEYDCFSLFHEKQPFLQNTSVCNGKPISKGQLKSAGSFFSEFTCGTNIAHFHHGDDEKMRLCLRCATIGLLRVIPWSQSGGAGLSPSVHNAPPIMAMACGENLSTTLGLNLVPLPGEPGQAKWTGHFEPTNINKPIPYLEAFTWNPRRIYLPRPETEGICWRCGQRGVTVGPLVFQKNEQTKLKKKGSKTIPFEWDDPAAFYSEKKLHVTIKSSNEVSAAVGTDLKSLINQENSPASAVATMNADHKGWLLVIPCTNPANNKTYDHRQILLSDFSADAIHSSLPVNAQFIIPSSLDGWTEPHGASYKTGAVTFVQTAVRLLTHADWAVLSGAIHREMHDSPEAFDIFSGLFWSLRGKVSGLPSRNVAWLVLKLMAAVPPRARILDNNAGFSPLHFLPKRQLEGCRNGHSKQFVYPVSFPRSHRLEAGLHRAIEVHLRQRTPETIDWPGLCYSLEQLLNRKNSF